MRARRLSAAAVLATGLLLPLAASPAAAHPDGPKPVRDRSFEFALLTDIQYADIDTPAGSTRYYRDSPRKLAEAVKDINAVNPAFAVHMGDIIDKIDASYDTILPVWNQIRAPKYAVLGNHEFTKTLFSDAVADKLNMPNQYYAWSRPGWRFIVLDTTRVSLFANETGSANFKLAETMLADLLAKKAVNAQEWNGAVGATQLKWLRWQLADAKLHGQKAIVFGHAPVFGENMHNAWDSPAVRQAFEQAGNVVAYFCGHDHKGRYEYAGGIHYVNMKGFVEDAYPATRYAFVDVRRDRLVVDGIGAETDRVLRFDPNKGLAGK